ncbi:hypothetical protein [Haloglycomyces albus]|uniref:hypothetical protein n=1 Tax=Haloglycomyces albus TaxID=526067 RepID=UPI00046C9EC8|nr:hypothetical protein [Haloglycomyces albus]
MTDPTPPQPTGFGGDGYFERFWDNIELLQKGNHTLGINTFTSPNSVTKLSELAGLINGLHDRIRVEYWLVSQYRPIGRPNERKAAIYNYDRQSFDEAATQAHQRLNKEIAFYAQPTRSEDEPYPLRLWLFADGRLSIETGSVTTTENPIIGNVLNLPFQHLYEQATNQHTRFNIRART